MYFLFKHVAAQSLLTKLFYPLINSPPCYKEMYFNLKRKSTRKDEVREAKVHDRRIRQTKRASVDCQCAQRMIKEAISTYPLQTLAYTMAAWDFYMTACGVCDRLGQSNSCRSMLHPPNRVASVFENDSPEACGCTPKDSRRMCQKRLDLAKPPVDPTCHKS